MVRPSLVVFDDMYLWCARSQKESQHMPCRMQQKDNGIGIDFGVWSELFEETCEPL